MLYWLGIFNSIYRSKYGKNDEKFEIFCCRFVIRLCAGNFLCTHFFFLYLYHSINKLTFARRISHCFFCTEIMISMM